MSGKTGLLLQRRTDESCHRLIQIFMNLSVFVIFTLKAWTLRSDPRRNPVFCFQKPARNKKRCRSTLMSVLHHNWCCSINTAGRRAGEGGFLVVCSAAGSMMERTSWKVEFLNPTGRSRPAVGSLWTADEWVSHRHGWNCCRIPK